MSEVKEGDLRVWWIPQVPGKGFYVSVKDVDDAKKILDTLAKYDLFQFASNVKPDYSNAGGLEVYEMYKDGEWSEWYSESEEADEDISAVMRKEGLAA